MFLRVLERAGVALYGSAVPVLVPVAPFDAPCASFSTAAPQVIGTQVGVPLHHHRGLPATRPLIWVFPPRCRGWGHQPHVGTRRL